MIFRYKRFFSSLSGKYLGIGLGILVLIIVGSVVPKFLGNKDNVVLAATNLLTNGDFETWSGGNPTGWSVLNPGGSGNGTLTQETTIKHAGASSEKNTCGSSGPTHSYQAYTFATAGDTYVVSAWGYTPSANTKMAANILVLDGEFGTTATQLWNFSTNAWEAIVGNNPTPGITPINTVGNTWEQISENITVPASKQVVIALINQSSGASVTGEAVYYDDVSLALPAAPAVYNGNLLSVNSDSKTKLVWANDLYYLAFSSSTADGTYNVYMTTSTTGVLGTWSEPRSVFTGIKSTTQSSSNYLNGFFAFDYNSVGNYFGLAAFASSTFSGSGTGQVWFTSSTNAFSWSATTTVGSNLTTGDAERQIYMDFSETEEFVGVTIFGGYSPSTQSKFYTVYSTNKGVTWTPSSALVSTADDNSTLIGFKVSGTGASRIFHMGYYQTALPFNLVYASSTDNIGTSWTTSTLASPYVNLTGPGDIAFSYLVSLAVDDNGLPGVLYFDPISSSGSGPFNVAANLMYQKKGSNGSWTTTNLGSNSFVLTTYANHQPMNLMYFNTNDPITFSLADGATPLATANTSTLFGNLYSSATPLGDRSGLAQAYNTTSENWAGSWVTSAGQLTFVTSSLPIPVVGSAPTAPSNFATSTVTASTIGLTWTDNASDETAFDLGTSTNGTSFTSSTIAANATSATVNTLNPNTAHWFLLAAYNSYGTSTYRSLTQTYTNPAVPGVPVVTAVTTSTLTLTWNGSSNGSGTTYQVYNDTDSSVVGTTTNTTYPVTGLTQGTEYKFNVRARYLSDGISYSAYSTTSTATTTLAYGVTLSKTTGAVTVYCCFEISTYCGCGCNSGGNKRGFFCVAHDINFHYC
ncbi:MAG: fibronectin type III domain-containing protein [Candidatus Magasanikbacteria bacterium]|nr:fibronectin type III domain-containing protein [Candidatus Magasanikbacteria bacterium]